jgi:hypothetical protein
VLNKEEQITNLADWLIGEKKKVATRLTLFGLYLRKKKNKWIYPELEQFYVITVNILPDTKQSWEIVKKIK